MTKEEIFNKNIKLAYKIANKYRINHSEEFDDIKQIALMGLWKAVTRYNGKNTLSTFAYVVIQNEINLYLRKSKKSVKAISINTEFKENVTIEDILQADDSIEEFLDHVEQEEIKRVLNEVLENEKKINKQIYEMHRKGYKQHPISVATGTSQANVSRIISKINKKVSEKLREGVKENYVSKNNN